MTFANIARRSGDDTRKQDRNRKKARHGFDTVVHFLGGAKLEASERGEINRKIAALKKTLGALGETFP